MKYTTSLLSTTLFFIFMLSSPVESKIGELCHDSSSNYGTCQPPTWCRSHAGKTSVTGPLSGLCPNDAGQKTECCFKPECAPEHSGWFCDYQGGRENCRDGVWGG
ncbi:hypothetical protein VTL71DRAFT_4433 [Oculimacula yallundae]|uniref:Uncharacterized protein n=1 Tax=Oculimacula yallundae TaxID=86028 RepID=A0ABR4C208_9HELO